MSEEFMARMFDPFEQQDFGGSRIFEGTGLGLSISRKLVELLNGTISAESEPGKGTVFTVKIPMKISDKKQKVRKLGETIPFATRGCFWSRTMKLTGKSQ